MEGVVEVNGSPPPPPMAWLARQGLPPIRSASDFVDGEEGSGSAKQRQGS